MGNWEGDKMLDINKMVELAQKEGFKVVNDADTPGFFLNKEDDQVKVSTEEILKICISDGDIPLEEPIIWDSLERRIVVKKSPNIIVDRIHNTWDPFDGKVVA